MDETDRLSALIRRAQAGEITVYDAIVRRFQDMGVGYAASILGDFHLAEDAAQEAFVVAWRELPRLREPAAFAGWLRKIIFRQCDRLTRGKRLTTALPIGSWLSRGSSRNRSTKVFRWRAAWPP